MLTLLFPLIRKNTSKSLAIQPNTPPTSVMYMNWYNTVFRGVKWPHPDDQEYRKSGGGSVEEFGSSSPVFSYTCSGKAQRCD